MQTKEKGLNKETQRAILRQICEQPSNSLLDIVQALRKKDIDISQDDVGVGIRSINPIKTWNPLNDKELRAEILNYIWTIEAQLLFVFPIKQKDNTLLDINQMRLSKGQSKITKDIVRTLSAIIGVEGKGLANFRKILFERSVIDDVNADVLANWAVRICLFESDFDSVQNLSDLSNKIVENFNTNFAFLKEKAGKNMQRAAEKFTERYFLPNAAAAEIIEHINSYKNIHRTFKDVNKLELSIATESQKQTKLIEDSIEKLDMVKEVVCETHEGGTIGKLLSGKVKNKDGVVGLVNEILANLQELNNTNNSAKSTVNEKSLLLQKVQNDLESTLLLKGQVEVELKDAKDKLKNTTMKFADLQSEVSALNRNLDVSKKEIFELTKQLGEYTNIEINNKVLREEVAFAKDVSVKLHARLVRLKEDFRGTIGYAEIIEPELKVCEQKSEENDSESLQNAEQIVENKEQELKENEEEKIESQILDTYVTESSLSSESTTEEEIN